MPATIAPAMPNQTYWVSRLSPNTDIAKTTPRLAPAETPRIRESARGLRGRACMITPATARPAPTTRPTTVRGTRSERTTSASGAPGSNSAASALSGLIARAPTVSDSTTTASRTTVADSSRAPRRAPGIGNSFFRRRSDPVRRTLLPAAGDGHAADLGNRPDHSRPELFGDQ